MPFVSVSGVQVNFPFDPYPCQVTYMEKVMECLKKNVNGVLESPTGTGKTLCLLCSSLAWLQDRKAQTELNRQVHISSLMKESDVVSNKQIESLNLAKNLSNSTGITWGSSEFAVPKIIYASRTHSQLTQAIQEMKRTAYNSMNVCVIGSREQLCIHEQVSKETNNTNKVHMCKAKVLSRTCHYYNHLDEIKKNSDARQLIGPVMDIEDLTRYGAKQRVCPYYMARELKNDADIIFMPYNYLLDPKSRKAHGVEIQGNIIIFDEAHNLEKICEDSSSFDLTSADIASAIDELQQLANKLIEEAKAEADSLIELGESSAPVPEFDIDDVLKLKATCKELEEKIDEINLPSNGKGLTKPGVFIFELFSKVNITFESKNFITDKLERIVGYVTSDGGLSGFSTKGAGLSKLNDILKIVFSREVPHGGSLYDHQFSIAKSYKVHIQQAQPKKKNKLDLWTNAGGSEKLGRILSYWCFSPGHTMTDLIAHGIKCIILTSGTLSPLDSFTAEMQIPFPVRLENPHVIEKHQVWIGTLGKGPDGVTLNSNFETRFNASYQSSLGNAVVNFARVVPNGLLIFFPSYPVMEKCLEHWQANNIWNRISQYKPIFVEPRGKTAFYDAMEEFYEKINDQSLNGAIFVAVCRGKVSEGLDFSEINGRAVVITGLPYPPRMDPKVILKMQFLDEMKGKQGYLSLSGSEWYRQQASRAVNQAIGRVIRHKQDYGAIMLCDTRFSSPQSRSQLPLWLRSSVVKYETFGLALKDSMVFFKTAEKLMPTVIQKKRSNTDHHIGAQGAYFMHTTTKSLPKAVTQARTVTQHVPSLNYSAEEETRLKTQYVSNPHSSAVAKSGQTLLDALSNNEKYKSQLDDDNDINGYQSKNANMEIKKLPSKRKIVVKRRSSTDQGGGTSIEGGVSPAISSSNLQTADNYISQVKSSLGHESYKQFSKALLQYKKTGDFSAVTSIVVGLFMESPEDFSLLRQFYKFVRPKDKQQFNNLCEELTGEGCGYKPEHAISRKRLQNEADLKNQPEKKQKLCNELDTATLPSTFRHEKDSVLPIREDNSSPSAVSQDRGDNSSTFKSSDKSIKDVCRSNALRTVENNASDSCNNSTTGNICSSEGKESQDNLLKPNFPLKSEDKQEKLVDKSDIRRVADRLKNVDGPLDIYNPVIEASGYMCSMCHQDAVVPFKAACQHICCFKCWKQVFESTKTCPECGDKVKRRHLLRLCFTGPCTS